MNKREQEGFLHSVFGILAVSAEDKLFTELLEENRLN
jgi:hypothetical protein